MIPGGAYPVRIGRYALGPPIAAGGMATIHVGLLLGEAGFSRPVAIKRMHPGLSADPHGGALLLDEARLASRVRHPNVVPTLDVIMHGEEILLVMEYVHGDALSTLVRAASAERSVVPLPIVSAIVGSMLQGLHQAHEATDDQGEPMGLVHRDVSPQNVLVGLDGVARVVDFGIAKARDRLQPTTAQGIKGKIAYMAPEQLQGQAMDRRTDVYASGVMLWELVTGQRLFGDATEVLTLRRAVEGRVPPPSSIVPGLPAELEEVTLRALASEPYDRFDDARQMARALERAVPPATADVVGKWVAELRGSDLARREEATRAFVAECSARESFPTSAAAGHEDPVARAGGDRGDGRDARAPATAIEALPARRSGRLRAIATLGGLALALFTLVAAVDALRSRDRALGAAGSTLPAGAFPLAPESASPGAPPGAVEERPMSSSAVASAGSAGEMPPLSGGAPFAASSAAPPARRGAHPPRMKGAGAKARARASHCNPPYVLDEDGVRRYKPECPLE